MLQYALDYAKRGWYVFPLKVKGKEPLTQNGFKDATIDEKQITDWWKKWPNANIGIATGQKSNLTVLDVDAKSGGFVSIEEVSVPDTPKVATGGGGRHCYFKFNPDVKTTTGIKPGLDIRSEGGYVVAPPSIHENGNAYIWEDEDLDLAVAPSWMVAQKKTADPVPEVIPSSQRNATLTSLAGTMRRRNMSYEAILQALKEENKNRCVPPLPANEIEHIAKSVSRYEPKPDTVRSDEKFISVSVGRFTLQAQRIKKLSSMGVKTPVSLDAEEGKVFGDVVNISKQASREEFINQCPVEVREELHAAFNRLENLLVQDTIAKPSDGQTGNKEFNGLIETDKGYVRMTENGPLNISSGILIPEYRIETKNGEVIKAKMFGQSFYIPRRSWDTKREWLKNFNSADFHFFGGDFDIQSILGLITQKYDLPRKKGSEVIGRFYDCFVFPNVTVNENGIVKEPTTIFISNGNPLENDFFFKESSNKPALVKEIYSHILKINRPETMALLIGMKFAQPFAPQIREVTRSFPILYGFGTAGSGKSTTLRLFRRLFGQRPEPQVGGKTAFSYLRLGSATNASAVSFDEIKFADMTDYKKDALMQFIRWSYDGSTEVRGRSDQSLMQYDLLSPVECFGEQFPNEDAVLQRIVPVYFSINVTEKKNYEESLREFDALDLEAFAELYYAWALKVEFFAMWEQAIIYANTLLGSRKIVNRIRRNLMVMLFGLVAFEEFGKKFGVELQSLKLEDAIKEALDTLTTADGRPKKALDYFLEQLDIMAMKGKIAKDREYAIVGDRLYIHTTSCVSAFRQFARETNYSGEVFDSADYTKQAHEESLKEDGYVVAANKKAKIGRVPRNCIILDVQKALKTIDLGNICLDSVPSVPYEFLYEGTAEPL